MANIFGWKINLDAADEKLYQRGHLKMKVKKVREGWKIMTFKEGKLLISDIVGTEGMAKTLVGEELFIRVV